MEAAIAILLVGAMWVMVYHYQQNDSRAQRKAQADDLADLVNHHLDQLTENLTNCIVAANRTAGSADEAVRALAPLCESLAESLTARMSTIDYDMADLRTRVERATGTSTLSL